MDPGEFKAIQIYIETGKRFTHVEGETLMSVNGHNSMNVGGDIEELGRREGLNSSLVKDLLRERKEM